jgi:uncharacterized membrane protein YdjX (TVP38/TMEM64 family)
MTNKKRGKVPNAIYGYLIVIFIMIILGLIYKEKLSLIYSDPQVVKEFIASFGIFGPLILITLQTLQVIIFIIPGPVFTIAGGYAFGIFWGTIYSLIGTLFGSILVFYLGRKYGRPFVESIVNKNDLKKFDKYFKKKGKPALFITRAIPVFLPNDLISFASSLTKLKYKEYIIISLIGFIPNLFLLNLFGDQISQGATPLTLIILSILGILLLVYLFRDLIKKNKEKK